MSFAWPTHISWQQHVAKPIPTLRSDIQKLEATTRANTTRSDPMTVFPKNPSFVAALNRSKTVTVRTLSPATDTYTSFRYHPQRSTCLRQSDFESNPAVYVMQRNMFERVKTTGNGCLSCRGNK